MHIRGLNESLISDKTLNSHNHKADTLIFTRNFYEKFISPDKQFNLVLLLNSVIRLCKNSVVRDSKSPSEELQRAAKCRPHDR